MEGPPALPGAVAERDGADTTADIDADSSPPVVRRRRKVDFNIDEVGTPESIQDVVSVSGSGSGNAADDGDGDEPDPPEELERYL
jgi:hypothetical protein